MEDDELTITVNASALRQVLYALNGPPHLIRELQATRDRPPIMKGNPIDYLIREFNSFAEKLNEQKDNQPPNTPSPENKSAC